MNHEAHHAAKTDLGSPNITAEERQRAYGAESDEQVRGVRVPERGQSDDFMDEYLCTRRAVEAPCDWKTRSMP